MEPMRFNPEPDESADDDLFGDLEKYRELAGLKEPRYAKLVGDEVVECSLKEWMKTLKGCSQRVIKQERVGDRYWVSSVFLGFNHGWGDEALWFETMIFDEYSRDEQHGLRQNIYCERYSTLEEARR